MPIKVAFMQLSSCWGCHQSLLNAHLGLLPILPQLEIVSMNMNSNITNDGIKNLSHLQYICFETNSNFTDDGVCNLRQLQVLKLLKDTK